MSVTSSNEAQNLLRQREKDKKRTLEDSIAAVLSTEHGKMVFRWLLSSSVCGLTSNAYVADSDRTIFLEGRRSIGVDIVNALEHIKPGAYATLVTGAVVEASEDRKHMAAAIAVSEREDNE